MGNSNIDILLLNKAILENPSGASTNELLGLLEIEDPDLKCLCPLARAIYRSETGRLTKACSAEALQATWCIDDSFASDTSWTGSQAQVREKVLHTIAIKINSRTISLGFCSSTEMTHYSEFWSDYVRAVSADDWKLAKESASAESLERMFSRLDEQSTESRPQGYPTDSGTFIGISSYQLVSIDGIPVEGPTYHDSYHEQWWEGLSDEDQDNEGNEDELGGFNWLNYLSQDQAEQLGLAAAGDGAIGPDRGHPEWAPRSLIEEGSEATWISTRMIYESYSQWALQVDPSTCGYIALGCGAGWDPTSNPNERNELGEDLGWLEYPDAAAPLYKVEIERGADECPEMLARLLPYFSLFRACLDA